MGCSKLIRFASQNFTTRKFHCIIQRCSSSTWKQVMKKELENPVCKKFSQEKSDRVCIYRVPSNLLNVEPKAFRPNNISIGPYHNGSPHLRTMEKLKKEFYCRLFDPNGAKLDDAFEAMEGLEANARGCYNGDIRMSSDEFLQMMLIDCSFIIQLLRDLQDYKFGQIPYLNRWMLQTIRREMIMLENQIPLFVIRKLFDLTKSTNSMSLEALALRFFCPLFQVDLEYVEKVCDCDEFGDNHFLDLLRSSIRPKLTREEPRGFQRHMIRSATELTEAGVKIRSDKSRRVTDVSFTNKLGFLIKELTIPPLYINDHNGTVLRNIVAFEKCHKNCHPDVTTYLFFFNGLINSSDDVALLHYKGVIHHSLGDDDEVAELINNISKGMVIDKDESYLYRVVNGANEYYGKRYAKIRGSIVHNYLTSWVVGVSTIFAVLALFFTLVQTVCGFADSLSVLKNHHFGSLFVDVFVTPFRGNPSTTPRLEVGAKDSEVDGGEIEGVDYSN